MTMTLEQTLRMAGAYIAWQAHGDCRAYRVGPVPTSAEVMDAIDAHLTQPAQSVDVEKVREVIAKLNIELGESDRFSRIRVSTVRFYLKKLTSALQEKGNGVKG